MTRQALELLLDRISTWPDAAQEELAISIESIETKHVGAYRLSEDERTAVRRGLQEMRAGKLADDGAVATLFDRFRA